ncbi:hypothetical protein GCM10009609_51160 [Pseudonocardia aurantiaca]
MWGPGGASSGLRSWDTRVVFVEQRGRWWSNAWREATKKRIEANREKAAGRRAARAAAEKAQP